MPSLRAIGFDHVPTRGGKDYIFRPTAPELEGSSKLYRELVEVVSKRIVHESDLYFERRKRETPLPKFVDPTLDPNAPRNDPDLIL